MIIRLTRVKLRIRLENFKDVFARVDGQRSTLFRFTRLRSTKVIRWLYPRGKICVTGGHVTSRDQGLYSNDQGRKRRETLGTRLPFDLFHVISTHDMSSWVVICGKVILLQMARHSGFVARGWRQIIGQMHKKTSSHFSCSSHVDTISA